jgi:branched-chain amino acid transport system ATP-binding protein
MLEVSGLTVSYGRHRALEGASLKVAKGEICVILGANGAGKSTLLKAIAGMAKADAGEMTVNGRSIGRLKPNRIVEEGIALVPEGRGIFGDLTVAENLQLGAFAARARRDEEATLERIYALFPRLAERRRQVARTMSGGEQQMVAIGRALMSKPEILMLDEPSLGLSPILTQELFRSLTAVAATGVGILLVEQNARQSLKIAKRGYLIENGHVAGENSAEALMHDPAVIAAYLGGAAGAPARRPAIHLPPAFSLPATASAIAIRIGALAERAGAISRAFATSARRAAALPSAFVGRYDPSAGGDPWSQAAVAPPAETARARAALSRDAGREAGRAALLAERAAERLARHVAQARLSRPVPSAFVRSASPSPVEPQPPSRLNGSHGLIGHNSAGIDIEDEHLPPPPRPTAAPVPARAPTIAELAARAAAIQAAHVAESRRRLSAFTVPIAAPLPALLVEDRPRDGKPKKSPEKSAGKKRKKSRKEN